MSIVNLRHATGATVQIHAHGAHITSWKTADGRERLFLSERADFKPGAAIRGGVPIIFPQFAALGPLPKHGFARTLPWKSESTSTSASTATFTLSQSPQTQSIWPHSFMAIYQVTLGVDELRMQLDIRNDDDRDFSFTSALHTYLRVTDIGTTSIQGLQGLRYRDSANGNTEHIEANDAICFAGEVDRIYFESSAPVLMNDSAHTIQSSAQGFADTVIWNPGAILSKKLVDMDDDGYLHMVCVEAAAIASPIKLAPGEQWQGTQVMTVNI